MAWLPSVTVRTLWADLLAGLTGAVIVLPQGVAYALIAGLPPQYGLYTAIVPPVIAGLFGSSRHLVSGPTAAISIVVFSVVSGVVSPDSPQFVPYVLTLTFMAGAIQFMLGLARVGTLVNFISHTVVVGFTTGAAVVIAVSQLRHFLGLDVGSSASFPETVSTVMSALPATNPWAVAIGGITLITAMAVRWLWPRSPGLLIAMVVGSVAGTVLGAERYGVERVGAIPGELPAPSFHLLSPEAMPELASGALAVAVIALIEAVAIARAVGMRSRQRIDGDQEFIGQGLSNIVGSLFSCYAASGSFTRTGANYEAGARTPLAAVFAASILLVVVLAVPGVTAYLPMPAMAAVVLVIAWNLVDLGRLRQIVSVSREETAILVVTFLATLLLDLEFAIYAGVLLSLLLFLKRSARPYIVAVAPMHGRPGRPLRNAAKRGLAECPQVKILRIDGPLFFGSADHLQGHLGQLTEAGYSHVVLEGSGVDFVDVAAAETLAQEAERFRSLGGGLWLCSFKEPAGELLRYRVFRDAIGAKYIHGSPDDAIGAIFSETPLCSECRQEDRRCCRLIDGARESTDERVTRQPTPYLP
ncbi:SulP family inorganic anion transporter [Aquisalimonas lutea]|uniref:SulP family inorganic anion transporter n=1 Tax=Aquisalimonas lutea TaxID=1327750 RepID=UPI0025B3BBA5|nr:SulP family inorganic anion transporter [Aquisalimonas lutea]MDN3519811.1 SulP family inorganic anion transporter [Aquisalimonas lutea]